MATRPANARLFLALWPRPEVVQWLAALQQQWRWPPDAAPVATERLHITLHFIGSVAQQQVPAIVEQLQVPFEPFDLALHEGSLRVWPGGIAVLELQAPPLLHRLHALLAGALHAANLPVEERRFRPHVTFARRATGARPPAPDAACTWKARDGYALVRSVPGRGYETLREYR